MTTARALRLVEPGSRSEATSEWHQLTDAERNDTLHAAQTGNATATETVLRAMLADVAVYDRVTNLAAQTRRAILAAHFGSENRIVATSLETRMAAMWRDLMSEGGGSQTEALLIERVVTCWLAANVAERDAALDAKRVPGPSPHADYYDRRAERKHRQFLQAVESLARVRRLLRPGPLVAQVNIAQPGAQQLNVATSE